MTELPKTKKATQKKKRGRSHAFVKTLASRRFQCAGGTYSFGGSDPSPKKYCSMCRTITS
jgi:hypothetical protein